MGGPNTKSAGTSEIARDSGGDSMSVYDASALEETLARLRQRYTLFFNLPDGVQPGQERNIVVDLTPEARQRFRDAEVRYRRTSMTQDGGDNTRPTLVTHAPSDRGYSTPSTDSGSSDVPTTTRRRVAVNEDGSPIAPSTDQTPAPVPVPAPTKQQ
jgi:hypothetical protein